MIRRCGPTSPIIRPCVGNPPRVQYGCDDVPQCATLLCVPSGTTQRQTNTGWTLTLTGVTHCVGECISRPPPLPTSVRLATATRVNINGVYPLTFMGGPACGWQTDIVTQDEFVSFIGAGCVDTSSPPFVKTLRFVFSFQAFAGAFRASLSEPEVGGPNYRYWLPSFTAPSPTALTDSMFVFPNPTQGGCFYANDGFGYRWTHGGEAIVSCG